MASTRTNSIGLADKAKIIILALMVAAIPLYLLLWATQEWLDQLLAGARAQLFGQVLVAILLESLPFVLAGSIVSGLLEALVPADRIARLVPRNRALRLLAAAGMGVVLPLCNCGIVPVARRLVRKGVPLEMAVVYMLAGPLVNPIVIASTAVAFSGQGLSLQMALARVLCGLTVAVAVGLLAARWGGDDPLRPTQHESHNPLERLPAAQVLPRILHCMVQDFVLLGGYLMAGAVVAAAFQAFVPRRSAALGRPHAGAGQPGDDGRGFCHESVLGGRCVRGGHVRPVLAGGAAGVPGAGPHAEFPNGGHVRGDVPPADADSDYPGGAAVLAVCELAGWLLALPGGAAAR